MFIKTYTLRFSDGRSVSAKIEAESPMGTYPIEWSGDLELLLTRKEEIPEKMRVSTLNSLFTIWEKDLGAKLKTESSGTYDREER
ncbi:MAG TPA: hypothetical protein VGE35_04150 [Candidatus Paceibacterota bacterium]